MIYNIYSDLSFKDDLSWKHQLDLVENDKQISNVLTSGGQ